MFGTARRYVIDGAYDANDASQFTAISSDDYQNRVRVYHALSVVAKYLEKGQE